PGKDKMETEPEDYPEAGPDTGAPSPAAERGGMAWEKEIHISSSLDQALERQKQVSSGASPASPEQEEEGRVYDLFELGAVEYVEEA
ncbi:MAG: hypothetical protein JXB45_12240, partial [Candidatus Krumholzibacteriota bacterium]|nr:hypothetical protein [Candidatus Krumholzibacteriota bacterium]